jgi:hypothetical protein
VSGTAPSAVARYYLDMATSTLGFLIPVWIVLLDETRGFTYTQISVLGGSLLVGSLVLLRWERSVQPAVRAVARDD